MDPQTTHDDNHLPVPAGNSFSPVAVQQAAPAPEPLETTLRRLGAVTFDLVLPETHMLEMLIQPHEHVLGIVYGKYTQDTMNGKVRGRGALVATDRRVLLIDRKPLFVKSNEIAYRVVSAVTFSKVGMAGTIVLHTRLGNISIRTLNQACAYGFIRAIESNIFPENGEEDKFLN